MFYELGNNFNNISIARARLLASLLPFLSFDVFLPLRAAYTGFTHTPVRMIRHHEKKERTNLKLRETLHVSYLSYWQIPISLYH